MGREVDRSRSLVFRTTLIFVAVLVVAEIVVFGFLYWSSITLYERHMVADIERDAHDLRLQFVGMTVTQMAGVVTRRSTDNPGEPDTYILATETRQYIAGNIRVWPEGVADDTPVVGLTMHNEGENLTEQHLAKAMTLPSGHRLLVGRNLTGLQRIRILIGKSLVRSIVLTLVIGVGGGYLFSRAVSRKLDRINESALAILSGDIRRRVPVMGTGDEIDELSKNLNRMLDRIEALMRGMREVTDNVAHDIRKPISRLRSRIEVTLMGPQDPATYREALERTIDEADHLLAMFNSLLTIAEAESGALRNRFETVDLVGVARSAVEFYEPLAEERGMSIELQTQDSVPVRGERHLIAQAVGNLLDNAIKHAAGCGPVSIRVSRKGADAVVTVADRGPGIPEASRKKVLERFARLDKSRTTPGSGLGLSLVSAVASLHEGTLTLRDHRPGLEVTLTLPAIRV
jgi:signal transduction histidine kinase